MACNDKYVKVLYQGVDINKDQGCVGDRHLYTTETNLSNPTYKWSLDGTVESGKPLLGTKSSFTYTFDNKHHVLYCSVHDDGLCGVHALTQVTGITCTPPCPNNCAREEVNVTPGYVNYLTSHLGNLYQVSRGYGFECATRTSNVNDDTCRWIQDYLKGLPNCSKAPIKVLWENNANRRSCIKLIILNSPIKFTQIMVDGTTFNFDTTNC